MTDYVLWRQAVYLLLFLETDGLRIVATSSLFTVILQISRPHNYCRNKHAASFILSDRFTNHVLSRQQLLYCYFTEIDILRIVATSGFFAVILQRLTNHVLSRQAAYLLLFYRDWQTTYCRDSTFFSVVWEIKSTRTVATSGFFTVILEVNWPRIIPTAACLLLLDSD